MILTCPSCGTQYVVKDGAIPPEGRQVRCASCKHSWHQDAPAMELTDEVQGSVGAPESEESVAEATMIEPRSGPEAEERAYEEAMIDEGAPEAPAFETEPSPAPVAAAPMRTAEPVPAAAPDWDAPPQAEAVDEDFSPFAAPDESEPRRSRRPLVALLVVFFVIAALVAAFWFLAPPEWRARVGLGPAGASPLALVTTHMDRQQLESGNELLTVSGRVINPTSSEQDVPPLRAQLRSKTGKVVYSWVIAPPAPTLAAGASAPFNSAEVNVPPGGDELTITLGAPRA
jgi:predicted Zn finger-like uncharacterized protein